LTGAGGLLGGAFRAALTGQNVFTLGRHELDVDAPDLLVQAVRHHTPELVINCAAHTDVEAAERNPDLDFKVNGRLPGVIGDICRRHNASLIHFSSTGCYGNWKSTPYSEEDDVRPTTAHHRAKLAGEAAVRASGCRHLILRTGWLFGGLPNQPKNFVWNRLIEACANEVMTSDASQHGCPTYVLDLARQTLLLARRSVEGTFNAVAHGSASRYEYVAAIVAAAGLSCVVKPVPGFKRLAPVSSNETAVNVRLKQLNIDQMREWQPSLQTYVSLLMASLAWDGNQRRCREQKIPPAHAD
jgi:dTDP-4-dehydrorhamnose reductase